MAKKSVDELLVEANGRLRAGRAGVTISPVKGMLYLRATLPPKPSSSKDKPYQQRLSLGIRANVPGVKKAEAEARKLSADLANKEFDWGNWTNSDRPSSAKTIGDWVSEFEADYFRRRGRTPKTETTWDKDYRLPFSRLPQHRQLTGDILIETAVSLWDPDTRSRQRACACFGRLAKFAGIEVNLSQYRGDYSPKAVNPRDLPSDEAIVKLWKSEENESWRNAIALIATYGLRPHEIFYVEQGTTLKEPPGVCTVTDGKTGWRQVWPYMPEWWELFGLNGSLVLPSLTARKNQEYGIRIAQWVKRHDYGIVPYDLRHAWAARTAVMGLDPAIAAKMMGHDLSVHTKVYHQFISKASLQAAWERSKKP